MRYYSKTKADRIIFGVLMCKLAKGHYAVDRADVQRHAGLNDIEFLSGLEMLMNEGLVSELRGDQLALTQQGVMCYEGTRPLTYA